MQLEYMPPSLAGWAEIAATPTDFDAYPPVPKLRVKWPLGEANVDRTAVAASLIFAPWIAGRCDHIRQFSALTEQRLVEWFQGERIWVAPTPVRVGGLPIPRGTRRILLGDPDSSTQGTHLRLQAVSPLVGSGKDPEVTRIASNLAAFLRNSPTPEARYCMEVGFAVLVAESLSANEIIHPEFGLKSPSAFSAAARLLESVSLGLRRD